MKAATGGGNTAVAVRGENSAVIITQKKVVYHFYTRRSIPFYDMRYDEIHEMIFKFYCIIYHTLSMYVNRFLIGSSILAVLLAYTKSLIPLAV